MGTAPQARPAPDAFDALMGTVDYSMYVVTVRSGAQRGGCLVGFEFHRAKGIEPGHEA